MAAVRGKPKGKIKPPRLVVTDQASQTWTLFSQSVKEIQNNNALRLSYEENYRYAYNLVLLKHGDVLYNGVADLISKNLDRLVKELILPALPSGNDQDPMHRSQEGERLMKAFRKVWEDHESSLSKLRDLLKYMDRTYTQSNHLLPMYDKGIEIFVRKVIDIQSSIVSVILDQIRIEREGYVVGRSALKGTIDILIKLSLFHQILEGPVLKDTNAFYEAEMQKLIDTCDAPQYLERVETRLQEEESRTMHYLPSSSHSSIKSLVQTQLLESSLSTLLLMPHSGLDPMMDASKLADLSRLYRLFSLVPMGIQSLRKELKTSIETRGDKINQYEVEEEAAQTRNKGQEKVSVALKWVQDILDLQDKFNVLLKGPFRHDKGVESSISEAFESFINRNSKSAEYLSLFLDDHLRKGIKGKTDDEIDTVLDKAILIFRFITDKDVFERYYKNHLSKRLLYGRSISDDAERGMLAKLKVECGYQFTQKLEGMFNDMRVSVDTAEAYKKHVASMEMPCIEMAVTVMTSTFWPMSHSPSTCLLPIELQQGAKLFERFYLSRHSGRKLTWQPSLGNGDVKVQFKKRMHDLNMPTFALVALLLFEGLQEGEELSYETIRAGTGIPDVELQRALQSLACAKFKILKKLPPSREVSLTDRFVFNDDFSAPLQKIKIGVLSSKMESNEERKETQDRIEEERRHQTEACIVRVMKDRKTMAHNALVTEVTKQLASRFQPVPLEIKKRIEALIERDYLERRSDRKSYNYLA